jgi:hypothetical protein
MSTFLPDLARLTLRASRRRRGGTYGIGDRCYGISCHTRNGEGAGREGYDPRSLKVDDPSRTVY